MKDRISKKYLISFSVILVLFGMMIVFCYYSLFNHYLCTIGEEEAYRISTYMTNTIETRLIDRGQIFVEEIQKEYENIDDSMSSTWKKVVWVFDEDLKHVVDYDANYVINKDVEMPRESMELITNAIQTKKNQISIRKSDKNALIPVVTIASIAHNEEGEVGKIILTHTHIQGSLQLLIETFRIMVIIMIVSIIIAIFAAYMSSKKISEPLLEMQEVTNQIIHGNYNVTISQKQKNEIGALAATLQELSDELSYVERVKKRVEEEQKQFLSNVSHELRTPVTVIHNYAESLEDGIYPQNEVQKVYGSIKEESELLQKQVNDLIDLTRLQNPSFQMQFEIINLNELVERCIRNARELAKKKRQKIEWINTCNYNVPVYGDYQYIRQLIMILLDNAVKFGYENTTITCKLSNRNGLVLSVKDIGKTIDLENQNEVFQKFYTTSENQNGVGLGLNIAKEIADRHQFQLQVSSDENETVFSIVILDLI